MERLGKWSQAAAVLHMFIPPGGSRGGAGVQIRADPFRRLGRTFAVGRRHDTFLSPHSFSLFPTNFTFSPDPPLFFPISVNDALTKTPTYPSTRGGAYSQCRGAFHDDPKL